MRPHSPIRAPRTVLVRRLMAARAAERAAASTSPAAAATPRAGEKAMLGVPAADDPAQEDLTFLFAFFSLAAVAPSTARRACAT